MQEREGGNAASAAALATGCSLVEAVEQDIWTWLNEFVTVNNTFYAGKFPPCPYARGAILASEVDVSVYRKGDIRAFIREKTLELRDDGKLSTRVMAFPPRVQFQWGMTDFIETLNAEVIPDNLFLNTGVTKTMSSRYPGSRAGDCYFIVVANRVGAVMAGSDALKKTDYYSNWPRDQYELVVERRARMVELYRAK
ncbi:hypothetical protein [uncultured Rhodoblastus sp.]|uniref:hypothetical protein n=1 Tax=uncultured Rhodoblastus sp. TaxID=543037 RepID=UPI0025D95A4F|nr:hypothetical protein [uncultured Rhodoblastus sp.]